MKRAPEIAVLALWAIAVVATFLIAKDRSVISSLGPVFFICMVGTIITVRKAREFGR